MTSTDQLSVLRDLLDGRIQAPEAAKRLLALDGPAREGLVLGPGVFSPEDMTRLASLMAAVRWETAKLLTHGRLPDVPYDSPQYQAFMATVPTSRTEPRDPAG
jgi:hypothetical protein